jgi:hypothetical protein
LDDRHVHVFTIYEFRKFRPSFRVNGALRLWSV